MGAADRDKAEASEELYEHVCLVNEVHIQAAKLAPLHVVDWEEVQEADTVLAALQKMALHLQGHPISKEGYIVKEILG